MRAVVVGLGRSGRAAARLLARHGVRVLAVDRGRPPGCDGLSAAGIEVRLAEESTGVLARADLLVVSPGVPLHVELVAEAHRRGIPVLGELGLALGFTDLPLVAITGTNGKSTVTTLIGDMLRAAGRRVFVGGNLGTPLAEFLCSGSGPGAGGDGTDHGVTTSLRGEGPAGTSIRRLAKGPADEPVFADRREANVPEGGRSGRPARTARPWMDALCARRGGRQAEAPEEETGPAQPRDQLRRNNHGRAPAHSHGTLSRQGQQGGKNRSLFLDPPPHPGEEGVPRSGEIEVVDVWRKEEAGNAGVEQPLHLVLVV